MSETMKKEYQGDSLKKESSNKMLGVIFLLLALLVLFLGIMLQYVQTGGLPNSDTVTVLIGQLHMKFIADLFIGFFTATFLSAGIYYVRQKNHVDTQSN